MYGAALFASCCPFCPYSEREVTWGATMGYSIVKESEHEFVVVSEEQAVLKCASRRTAAKTIADAKGLMHIPRPENKAGPAPGQEADD